MACILIPIAAVALLLILLQVVNVLQNGPRRWDGRSVSEILGVPAEHATLEDIQRLSKADSLQLFYAAAAPTLGEMRGECRAKVLRKGVLAFASEFYVHHVMGPGHWEAKAFLPAEETKGWGHNVFTVKHGEESRTVRCLKFDTFVGKSRLDGKDSFRIEHSAHNRGPNAAMRDEIRKINPGLFVGMGCLGWNWGTLNPVHFALHGKPGEWVGPDGG